MTRTELVGVGIAGAGLVLLSVFGFYARTVDRHCLTMSKRVGA